MCIRDRSKNDLASTLQTIRPNAVEIHTEINRLDSFGKVVSILKSSGMKLDKISISCGLNQSLKKSQKPEDLLKALWERYEILKIVDIPLIWQLDGWPMSGDLAPATSRDTVKLFEKIGSDLPPGLIQLAGGTNAVSYTHLTLPTILRV